MTLFLVLVSMGFGFLLGIILGVKVGSRPGRKSSGLPGPGEIDFNKCPYILRSRECVSNR